MECKRCGNQDTNYFAYDPFHENWYCRKCIAFGRINVNEPIQSKRYQTCNIQCHYELEYPLTNAQLRAMREIRLYLDQGKDVLVYAACGAGKTELVMESIMRFINQGKKVGFAISRRQVVLEIKERMAKAFPMLHVIAVCEGYTKETDGDLIVCTMHQLYRYPNAFDLLIMDEVDAFPYRGNPMLEQIAMHACQGQKLFLTATPDDAMKEHIQKGDLALVELFQRPHGFPLIVPQVIHTLPLFQYLYIVHSLHWHKREGIQVLLFVPTIESAHRMRNVLRCFFQCAVFTSKTVDKEAVIADFHQKLYDVLICTTILERGITIRGVHIIIYQADHRVFQEASLIQIIGRVGRNIQMPSGKGIFLCTRVTKDIQDCISSLQKMNESVENHDTKELIV